MLFKYVLFNFSPFLKRVFFFDSTLYQIFTYLPIFLLLSRKVSTKSIIFLIVVSCFSAMYYMVTNNIGIISVLFIFVLLVFKPVFKEIEFDSFFRKFLVFFLVSFAYGAYQKVYGYLPFEMIWIRAGVGAVNEAGYFVNDGIRPFSFYAGIPEFAFVCSIFGYWSFQRKQHLLCLVFFLMLFYIGSRGIIVSTFIAFLTMFILQKKFFGFRAVFVAFTLNIICYLMIFFAFPIFIKPLLVDAGRVAVFGTFNARVEMALELYSQFQFDYFWFGYDAFQATTDNMYINLFVNYGIFGFIGIFLLFKFFSFDKKSAFFVSSMVGYSLYADTFNSIFLLLNFAVCVFSYEKNNSCK
ncbi:membrane protein, putative [Aliivibrio fischeri MJ11]|uniref:Membrane protein, putative n=2 Tax=Aliivibrio fischeri TaxID=668 RepID=B5FFV0_ALIFM|nr:membrane protein, putative [Aliivibrio fischeri MJ11]